MNANKETTKEIKELRARIKELETKDGYIDRSRFDNKVIKTDTCWLWTGAKTGKGFGNVMYGRINANPHRVAAYWANLINSPFRSSDARYVGHSCNVKLCVNPEHLIIK